MDQVQKFLTKVYRGVGTSRAKRMEMLLARGEWALLQKESLSDVNVYQNAVMYLKDATIVELTRKLWLPGDAQRRVDNAIATFWASEAQCAATNARLDRFIDNQGPFGPSDEPVIHFISAWRKEIKSVLGRCIHSLEPGFSGGSTLSDKGKLTTIPDKMSSLQTAYHGFPSHLDLNFKHTPLEGARRHVRGNTFFTVRKDSEKDRGCCVEASLNVSLQLAVGKLLKKRYRRWYGVDLKYAQQIHRELARRASLGELDLATVDLSNASDTIARKLIKLLLPRDWYELLNSLRAHVTTIDGKTVHLNKFSSMGNGFTFELETIVFRSLCAVLSPEQSWVYGDDIIINQRYAKDLLSALGYFGFTPNKKKTFCDGPFRESCGGDFFKGVPVRAHYMKELPDEPQKWVSLANGIRRIDSTGSLKAAWHYCVDQLPTEWRNFGPEDLGDTVLHSDDPTPTVRSYTTRERDSTTGRMRTLTHGPIPMYRIMKPVSQSFDLGSYWDYRSATAAASLGVPSRVSPRDSITGYRPMWIGAHGLSDDPSWWTTD